MQRYFVLMITVFLLAGSVLFAGGQQEPAETDETVVLDFAPMYGAQLTEELYQNLIDRFEERNPGIEINLVLQPSSSVMHRDFLKTLQATGQFPDVMAMASPMDFVQSGLLMPLPIDEMDYLLFRDNQIIGGENYVAIHKRMIGGFWYNKDIFQSLDLEVPGTYDELIAVCEAIQQAGIDPIALGVRDGWPQLVLASMILSEDVLSENPDWGLQRNAGEVSFTDPEFVRAIEKYQELATEYSNDAIESVTYEQMKEMYFNGEAAMIPMGSWIVGEIDALNLDFEPGFFPVPGDESANNVSVWQNEGLAISAATEYPEEALDFIEFYMTDPVWYSAFLATESNFSASTADISYPMSAFRIEVGEQSLELTGVEHWYDMTGDNALLPGLQAYFNNLTARVATGADVMTELERYDQEWELANSNRQ